MCISFCVLPFAPEIPFFQERRNRVGWFPSPQLEPDRIKIKKKGRRGRDSINGSAPRSSRFTVFSLLLGRTPWLERKKERMEIVHPVITECIFITRSFYFYFPILTPGKARWDGLEAGTIIYTQKRKEKKRKEGGLFSTEEKRVLGRQNCGAERSASAVEGAP